MEGKRIGDGLKSARIVAGITVKEISDLLTSKGFKASPNTIYSWENDNSQPTPDALLYMCEKYGISNPLEYFGYSIPPNPPMKIVEKVMPPNEVYRSYEALDIYGKRTVCAVLKEETARVKHEGLAKVTPNRFELIQPADYDDDEEIPTYDVLYGVAAAAEGSGVYLDNCNAHITVVANEETRQADLVIKVQGRSMEPVYCDGDYVLVRLQPEIEIGEVGIWTIDGLGYIKERGDNRLISLNPDVDDVIIKEQTCRCVGKVIGKLDPELIVEQ